MDNNRIGILYCTKEIKVECTKMRIRKYYIRGVAVGLIIAWVTSALAYWKTGGSSTDLFLIEFEFALSIIFLIISLFLKESGNNNTGKIRQGKKR